jgi:Ca2+-binding RTX toxin-like protein
VQSVLGIENITQIGTGNITATGNDRANEITGNAGDNRLSGLGGDDIINGGIGSDTLDGGQGNDYLSGGTDDLRDVMDGGEGEDNFLDQGNSDDVYYIDNSNDFVDDRGGSADLAYLASGSTTYDMSTRAYSTAYGGPQGVENLIVTGVGTATVTGNALDNWLVGNEGRNAFSGGLGDDHLDGKGGSDLLYGNEGDDLLTGGTGDDFLYGDDGLDTLDGELGLDMMVGGLGDDTYFVDDIGDQVIENNGELGGIDTINANIVNTNLAQYANVENVTLMGDARDVTGSDAANVLTGNLSANLMYGKGGNDVIWADDGDDMANGDAGDDLIFGGDGNDSVTGGADLDSIYGGNGDDTLDGGTGADYLVGEAGNDNYYIDSISDVVIEDLDGGYDFVYASCDVQGLANIEEFTLLEGGAYKATGSGLNDTFTGNSSANHLWGLGGDDYFLGQGGADTMEGGADNDTYDEVTAEDVIIEDANGGTTDKIWTVADAIHMANNVENIQYWGSGNFHGWGNDSNNRMIGAAGNDTLEGGRGNDYMDASLGIDLMIGGEGDDTYFIRNIGDVASEVVGQGRDKVYLGFNGYTLTETSSLEVFRFLNFGAINFTGNNQGLRIYGGSSNDTFRDGTGNDMVVGGAGNDTLYMGLGDDSYGVYDALDNTPQTPLQFQGNDVYQYSASTAGAGRDRITDIDALAGNSDSLYMNGAKSDALWFSRSAQDLVVSVIGTDRSVTVADWFSTTDAHIETIYATADLRKLDHTKVDALISVMSTMTAPAMGQTTLTSAQLTQLTPTLTSTWTPA